MGCNNILKIDTNIFSHEYADKLLNTHIQSTNFVTDEDYITKQQHVLVDGYM